MGALYVQLAQDFGWSMEEIGMLTLDDVGFLVSGWEEHPPLAAIVAGFMGVKRPERPRRANRRDMAELAKMMGSK